MAQAKNMEENYCIYVLKSLKNGKRYVGMSSKNPKERLIEHNSGTNQYTRDNKPYILIYYELGFCKLCAKKREDFLKSGQGRKILDLIEKSGRSSIG